MKEKNFKMKKSNTQFYTVLYYTILINYGSETAKVRNKITIPVPLRQKVPVPVPQHCFQGEHLGSKIQAWHS